MSAFGKIIPHALSLGGSALALEVPRRMSFAEGDTKKVLL
jgi:hypothetical protein